MKSLQGQFLVASPHLSDGNFFRSVVLILQHDEDGAFGVVLTRPTNETLAEIWNDLGETDDVPLWSVLWGGPVDGPLLVLHQNRSLSDSEIMPGVYVTTEKDSLQKLMQVAESSSVRVFHGYSGWSAGQLEGELKVGGWLLAPATVAEVFYDKDDLWEQTVRKIGLEIIAPRIRAERVPDDPSVN